MRVCLIALGMVAVLSAASPAAADALTKVMINGVPTPVHFNDGDSFRVEAGPYRGARARLSGFNTLESFGPVHAWGDWTEKELYAIAKLATLTAQRGTWSCTADGGLDSYGRLLLFCRDLATALIEKGLAHAYSVDEKPADPALLQAQRRAMAAGIGMWAHGVPRYILTSLHSKAEGGGKDGETWNRLISTWDGHTERWIHDDNYGECKKICHEVAVPTKAELDQAVALVQADAAVAKALAAVPPAQIRRLVNKSLDDVLRGRLKRVEGGKGTDADAQGAEPKARESSGDVVPASTEAAMATILQLGLADKKLVLSGKKTDSCHVFVDFRRRFNEARAPCLR